MSTNNLTYMRPDGIAGVGFFIRWSGKFVHSVAWPDGAAVRMSVEEIDRRGIQVLGMETIGRDEREYLSTIGFDPVSTLDVQNETSQETGRKSDEATKAEANDAEADAVDPPGNSGLSESSLFPELPPPGDQPGNIPAVDGVTAESVGDPAPADVPQVEAPPAEEQEPDAELAEEPEPDAELVEDIEAEPATTEAAQIRELLATNPKLTNKEVISQFAEMGIVITSSQVTRERKNLTKV